MRTGTETKPKEKRVCGMEAKCFFIHSPFSLYFSSGRHRRKPVTEQHDGDRKQKCNRKCNSSHRERKNKSQTQINDKRPAETVRLKVKGLTDNN